MKHLLPSLLLLGVIPLLAAETVASASAQEVAVSSSASREDSIRLHRSARSRQAAFERVRRNHLPWAWAGGSGRCDERIGRFCLTYSDDDDSEWQPPEEDRAVIGSRERLLEALARAADTIPGDRWVAGQRVRYLVEAERYDEAREAAAGCRSERWWCEALRGFAEHHAGSAASADSAFSRMLETMPADARTEWTKLDFILETRTLRRYRRMDGERRARFEKRFWALADPLTQTGGNELRSEHFARNLLVDLQDRAETTENLSWGDDLGEILVRFGPPSGWERIRRPFQLHGQELSLVSHYPESDIDLLPPPELLEENFDPSRGHWDQRDVRARASYPLPHAGDRLRWLAPLDHQAAVFRGGDSALVVVAYQLPADSLPRGARVHAALSLRHGFEAQPVVVESVHAGDRGMLMSGAPYSPALVSLELLAAEERQAARARFGVEIPPLVPGLLATSDLLLLRMDGDTVAESREAALELARGSVRVSPGERIGVYWEMYSPGVPWPEALELSLRLVDADAGWLRRLAERAGVVREIQPIRLVWAEGAAGEAVIPRALFLQIPEDIGAGSYTLELTISAPGREPLVSRRILQVES